eukprot:1143502-Pelagomonas_calceolata.AAC.7
MQPFEVHADAAIKGWPVGGTAPLKGCVCIPQPEILLPHQCCLLVQCSASCLVKLVLRSICIVLFRLTNLLSRARLLTCCWRFAQGLRGTGRVPWVVCSIHAYGQGM